MSGTFLVLLIQEQPTVSINDTLSDSTIDMKNMSTVKAKGLHSSVKEWHGRSMLYFRYKM